MNKDQKAAVVERLTERLKESEAIFAIDYRGISVPQAAELRSGLREAGAEFRIVKNRLTLRAADAAGTEEIKDHLVGPTALTLVDGDVALAAKTISRLGSEWELLEYKGGIMDGATLDADSFNAIAKLPGRDQLNAQLAGIVASPITGLVRGLGSMVQGLALQLQAIADQGLVTGEAPPAEPEEESAEPPKEVEAPAAAEVEKSSPDEAQGAEDASSEEASTDAGGGAEDVANDAGDPDPEPAASPEEAPSEESAPEGEDAGEGVPQTGEGDADPAEAEDEGGEPAEETSDGDDSEDVDADKDSDKEDGS